MDNKKTIILGLIAVLALTGVVWYANQNKEVVQEIIAEQKASVVPEEEKAEQPEQPAESELIEELILGSPEAPVILLDYSSHFCGHCADFHNQTLPLIIEEYVKNGQVKVISKLVSPPELSMAVLCAGEQRRSQEFNDYLFKHIQELEAIDDLKIIAGSLNLNQDDFNQCLNSGKYEERINEWFAQAQESGISGTPTFFINNQMIVGNQPLSVFKEAIDQELNK